MRVGEVEEGGAEGPKYGFGGQSSKGAHLQVDAVKQQFLQQSEASHSIYRMNLLKSERQIFSILGFFLSAQSVCF